MFPTELIGHFQTWSLEMLWIITLNTLIINLNLERNQFHIVEWKYGTIFLMKLKILKILKVSKVLTRNFLFPITESKNICKDLTICLRSLRLDRPLAYFPVLLHIVVTVIFSFVNTVFCNCGKKKVQCSMNFKVTQGSIQGNICVSAISQFCDRQIKRDYWFENHLVCNVRNSKQWIAFMLQVQVKWYNSIF